jgi:ribonuclease H2 subunit A
MSIDKVISPVPVSCQNREAVILGIDEAGRGPVLGPMVYGCAYWAESDDDVVGMYGFDDSKVLQEEKRTELFEKIKSSGKVGYVSISLSAEYISSCMLRRVPYSLNSISYDAAIDLVRSVLDKNVNVTKVFVDTVGDPTYYKSILDKAFSGQISFTVSAKADSLFKTVSAASIVAKVSRDSELKNFKFKEPALHHLVPLKIEKPIPRTKSKKADKNPEQESLQTPIGSSPSRSSPRKRARESSDSPAQAVGSAGSSPLRRSPRRVAAALKDEEASFSQASIGSFGPSDETGLASQEDALEKLLEETYRLQQEGLGANAAKNAVDPTLHPSAAGTGYPGDPTTKAWLKKHLDQVFGWPSIVRFSWSTAKDLLDELGVKVEWEDPTGSDEATQMKLSQYFLVKPPSATGADSETTASSYKVKRAPFFRKRNMEHWK